MMWQIVIETLWFFLPAIIANMLPVFAAHYQWLPALNRPLDAGYSWRGQRLLGDNKTVRGLVLGIIGGGITGLFQYLLITTGLFHFYYILPFTTLIQSFLYGSLIGIGAIFGDSLKSFFKRRLLIAPGRSWKPWDQIDIVIGVWLLTMWQINFSIAQLLIALTVIGIGSYLVSLVGVIVGVKKNL